MITKVLDCQYYWCRVYIVWDCKYWEAEDWLRGKTKIPVKIDRPAGQADKIEMGDGVTRFYFYIEDPWEWNVLVHEAYHLADNIMEDRGVEERYGEQMAYYLEYWFRRLTGLF